MTAPVNRGKPVPPHDPHKPAKEEAPKGSKEAKKVHDSASIVIGKQINPTTGLKKAASVRRDYHRTSSYTSESPVNIDAALKKTREKHGKRQSGEQL